MLHAYYTPSIHYFSLKIQIDNHIIVKDVFLFKIWELLFSSIRLCFPKLLKIGKHWDRKTWWQPADNESVSTRKWIGWLLISYHVDAIISVSLTTLTKRRRQHFSFPVHRHLQQQIKPDPMTVRSKAQLTEN